MIKKLILGLFSAVILLSSCDDIAEGDRLIYVPPVKAERSILVEEFSGQLCVNCPDGAAVLEGLEEQLGADTVIVVSIHADAGGLGLAPGGKYVGLVTDQGEKLWDKYGGNSMPAAVFDRRTTLVNDYNLWTNYANYMLKNQTSVTLNVETTYSAGERSLDVKVTSMLADDAGEDLSGKLHVWLTEDSIVAPQLLKAGGYDFEHVFNSVFRTSVNDLDGDNIYLSKSATDANVNTFHATLDPAWRAEKMHVVVFIDKEDGVCQAARASVINH